jgi:plastocyanin
MHLAAAERRLGIRRLPGHADRLKINPLSAVRRIYIEIVRRKENGRRMVATASCAVAAVLIFGGIAFAATQTIVAADNSFPASPFNTDQGVVVPFQNGGGNQHNVTASATGPDGSALFRSSTISGGQTTQVNGTQYLTPGNYPFLCTIHGPSMSGTLVVTGSGTPQARPEITLKVISRKLAKVATKGKLLIEVSAATRSDDVSVEAKLGKTSLGKAGGLNLAAGAKQSVTLKLNKAAKNKLRSKKKATVTVAGTVPFGSPASAKGKLK